MTTLPAEEWPAHLQQGLRLHAHALREGSVEAAGAPGSLGLAGLPRRQALHQLRVAGLRQQPLAHLLCKGTLSVTAAASNVPFAGHSDRFRVLQRLGSSDVTLAAPTGPDYTNMRWP